MHISYVHFFLWRCGPTRARASSFMRFLDHTKRRTTVGRTPLDEWSDRRRDLYLTTHNTHSRQTSMPPAGFEPTISAGERQQTCPLDRAASGTGFIWVSQCKVIKICGKSVHCWNNSVVGISDLLQFSLRGVFFCFQWRTRLRSQSVKHAVVINFMRNVGLKMT